MIKNEPFKGLRVAGRLPLYVESDGQLNSVALCQLISSVLLLLPTRYRRRFFWCRIHLSFR